jgi:hypothetical protein
MAWHRRTLRRGDRVEVIEQYRRQGTTAWGWGRLFAGSVRNRVYITTGQRVSIEFDDGRIETWPDSKLRREEGSG